MSPGRGHLPGFTRPQDASNTSQDTDNRKKKNMMNKTPTLLENFSSAAEDDCSDFAIVILGWIILGSVLFPGCSAASLVSTC